MENKLNTLDGLVERLQEIREYIGHDCEVNVQVNRGNKYCSFLSDHSSQYDD